ALRRRMGARLLATAGGLLLLTGCSVNSRQAADSAPAAPPLRVDIPAINAHSTLVPLGLNPQGSIAVPPLSQLGQAGWHAGGPAYPGLRLITCGGAFNGATGHYVDNVVAFARLTARRSP